MRNVKYRICLCEWNRTFNNLSRIYRGAALLRVKYEIGEKVEDMQLTQIEEDLHAKR